MRRWASGTDSHGSFDGDVFNEGFLPFLVAIPTDRVAAMAVQTAEEIDQFLSAVSDEVVAAALARPDAPYLTRQASRPSRGSSWARPPGR